MPPTPSAGSMTALEAIYRKHQGLVRWVLRARGVPEVALDDRVHDVFLAIARRLPDRDPSVPMRAWVAGVARNVGFSYRRSLARQRSRAAGLPGPADPPQPDEVLERREAWHALAEFLDELGPEQREVFVMVEVTGMRVAELADTMGMPANTLHSRLKVARTRFSQRFDLPTERRAELLQCAREQGRVEPRQRRRTWAAIAGSVEGLGALPAASTLAGASSKAAWMIGSPMLTAVTLAVGVLGAAAVVGSRASSATASAERSAVATEAVVPEAGPKDDPKPTPVSLGPLAADPGLPASPAPAAVPRTARPRARAHERSRPEPSVASAGEAAPSSADADATLVAAMAAVRKARAQLDRGRAREALDALDLHGASFGDLERERRRLELDASCRIGDSSRTREAAKALVRLGASVDPEHPCPNGSD